MKHCLVLVALLFARAADAQEPMPGDVRRQEAQRQRPAAESFYDWVIEQQIKAMRENAKRGVRYDRLPPRC